MSGPRDPIGKDGWPMMPPPPSASTLATAAALELVEIRVVRTRADVAELDDAMARACWIPAFTVTQLFVGPPMPGEPCSCDNPDCLRERPRFTYFGLN